MSCLLTIYVDIQIRMHISKLLCYICYINCENGILGHYLNLLLFVHLIVINTKNVSIHYVFYFP